MRLLPPMFWSTSASRGCGCEELSRVVRPGGYIVTVNPVSWPYHEAPIDCWRVFPDGMQALLDDAGLEMVVNSFPIS